MKFYRVNNQLELDVLKRIYYLRDRSHWDIWRDKLDYVKITIRIRDEHEAGFITGHGDFYERSYNGVVYSQIPMFNEYIKLL